MGTQAVPARTMRRMGCSPDYDHVQDVRAPTTTAGASGSSSECGRRAWRAAPPPPVQLVPHCRPSLCEQVGRLRRCWRCGIPEAPRAVTVQYLKITDYTGSSPGRAGRPPGQPRRAWLNPCKAGSTPLRGAPRSTKSGGGGLAAAPCRLHHHHFHPHADLPLPGVKLAGTPPDPAGRGACRGTQ